MLKPEMMRVPSVMKTYLLSHPRESELTSFFLELLKQPDYQLLVRPCEKIMAFIPEQLETLYYCVSE